MRVWSMIRKGEKVSQEYEQEIQRVDWTIERLQDILSDVCKKIDIERPIVMQKHVNQLKQYGNTKFMQSDFLDIIGFTSFEIELIFDEDEKKKKLR